MANITAVYASLPVEAMIAAGRAPVEASGQNNNVIALHAPREAAEASKPVLAEQAASLPGLREVHLQLHIDERTGEVYGRFVDRSTGEHVREIPSQKLRDLAAQIKNLFGHSIDQTA